MAKTLHIVKTLALLLLLPLICVTENVPKEKAAKLAVNFFKSGIENKGLNLSQDILDIHTIYKEGAPVFYAFNFRDGGFVVTPTNDLFFPVLAYSFEGNFSGQGIPQSTQSWLDWYTNQILSGIENPDNCFTGRAALWDELLKPDSDFFGGDIGVDPLLTSIWNQMDWYNEMCPADPEGYAGHCPVGCVATAMSQLMYYYRFPPVGNGTNSYIPPYGDGVYGEQFADFGNTYYQWDEMQDQCPGHNPAVAELCYHCGVSLNMAYRPTSAGASTVDAPWPLINNFNYAPSAYFQYRDDLDSTALWIALLNENLDNDQPVMYRSSNGWGGHSYVCDGYQDSAFYHFNWGWSGLYNGFYYIDELTPGWINLNFSQGAVFNIYPDTTQFEYPVFCSGTKTITSRFGTIEDGSGPENYKASTQCQWLVQPEDTTVTNIILEFNFLDTELDLDTISIYDGISAEAELLGVFSGDGLPGEINSSSDAVFVTFNTSEDVGYSGWKLSYYGYGLPFCEGIVVLNDMDGFIEDGSKHLHYASNADCSWLIVPQVPVTDSIDHLILQFDLFSIAPDDTLFIYDGENTSMPLLGAFSGWAQPGDIVSNGNKVFLNFKTNGGYNGPGWEISYYSVNPEYCQDTVWLTGQSGLIEDGSGAKNYVENTNCYWVIDVPNAEFIVLDFMEVDLEQFYDFVKVYDLNNPAQYIERVTGHDPYQLITVNSSRVLLNFYTDYRDNFSGWKMGYHASVPGIEETDIETIKAYPNPFTNNITISIKSSSFNYAAYELFDLTGRIISKGDFNMATESINLELLEQGVYLLKVSGDETYFYQKIIKQ